MRLFLEGLAGDEIQAGVISYYGGAMGAELLSVEGLFARFALGVRRSPAPDTIKYVGARWFPTPFFIWYAVAVLWMVMRHRPDVMYLNNLPQQHLPAIVVARWLGLPVISHLRAVRPLTAADRWALPYVDRFLAVSASARNHFITEGVDADKVAVAYNIMPLADFDRIAQGGCDVAFESDAGYVVQVGRLDRNKRPLLAIDALAQALEGCSSLKLILIGDGELEEEVARVVEARGLCDRVVQLGPRGDVPAVLARCHIGLLLSQSEGFGNVVLEYMAARLPVVVTDIPSIDEMAVRGETAWVLEDDSPQAIASLLVRLGRDPDLRRAMGLRGRRKLENSPFVRLFHDDPRLAFMRKVAKRE